uniref:Deoxyribonuclease ii n=1 Tax=Rhipicephalus zambeziensis TaxID=60191 RepID=A0A224YVG7_9ACAR
MTFASESYVLFVLYSCLSVYTVPCMAMLSCKNSEGKDVDWFVVYKLPKIKHNKINPWMTTGEEMAYYDCHKKTRGWYLLPFNVSSQRKNPIWETLKPIYGGKHVAFVAYNDQPPKGFNGTRGGHSKGILMASKKDSGRVVWLQHSVPQFVGNVTESYIYPHSGRENGQLFFCLSFRMNALETIATHLHVQAVHVYQNMSKNWTADYPKFSDLLNKKYDQDRKTVRIDHLKTTGKRRVLAIAKSPRLFRDIYEEEMKTQMKDSIVVQSWRNGVGGAQESYCKSGYSVTNVEQLRISTQGGQVSFSSREDHSKWYITKRREMFCFSTLNRMRSQMKRGGEITCLLDSRLVVNLFSDSIARTTGCSGTRVKKPGLKKNQGE